jgi:hypothetical protein
VVDATCRHAEWHGRPVRRARTRVGRGRRGGRGRGGRG